MIVLYVSLYVSAARVNGPELFKRKQRRLINQGEKQRDYPTKLTEYNTVVSMQNKI